MYTEKIQEVLHAIDDTSGPTYNVKPLEKVHIDDDYNVFATEIQHSEKPESINNTYVVETADSNIIPDSMNMCDNEKKDEQNAGEPEDERVLLASLIANLKLDVDENKKIQKQLKKANTSLTQELDKYKLDKLNRKMIKINDLKAQLQDNTIMNAEMRALLNRANGKSVDTKFEKLAVVRQPNAFRLQKLNTPTQVRTPQLSKTFKNSNPPVSTSTGVIYNTSISRPQLKSTQMKDKIIEIILYIVDSRCTKHMTGNLKLMCNFVDKYLGTVRFGNDQFALILGYGDFVQGNVTIKKVYYVEGLNHNLFSVGQFCDADFEVAFRKSTCFVRDLQGNDLLMGNHGYDLYTIYKNHLHEL
ncbi:hypothetical protein Tco_1307148 [Tanacetum coccineum]